MFEARRGNQLLKAPAQSDEQLHRAADLGSWAGVGI